MFLVRVLFYWSSVSTGFYSLVCVFLRKELYVSELYVYVKHLKDYNYRFLNLGPVFFKPYVNVSV